MYTLEQIFEHIKMPEECAKLSLECLDRHKDTETFKKLKADFYNNGYVKDALYDYAEEMGEPFSDDIGILFGMDTSDPAQRMPQDPATYRATAEALAGLFELAGGYGNMDAVIEERGQLQELALGGWKLAVRFADTPGAVVALPVADDEAYVLLMGGAAVQPQSVDAALPHCDLLLCEEGSVVEGTWMRDRRLNGDETAVISADAPTLLRMKVFCYA